MGLGSPPRFFVSADYKGFMGAFFVNLDSKRDGGILADSIDEGRVCGGSRSGRRDRAKAEGREGLARAKHETC